MMLRSRLRDREPFPLIGRQSRWRSGGNAPSGRPRR